MTTTAYDALISPLEGIRTARAFVHLREQLREQLLARQGAPVAVRFDPNRMFDEVPVQALTVVERQIVDGQIAVLDEIWSALREHERVVLFVLYGDVDRGYDEGVRVLLQRGHRTIRGLLPDRAYVHRTVHAATETIAERIKRLTKIVPRALVSAGDTCA